MSIVCILQRKRTWLCPHCPSPSVLTRENLQAKLRQKVRLCYMTVSSALSRTEWATVERLCEIAYVCRKRDNLVLAGSKWLIMLCIVFWGNGGVESSHRPKTRGSFLAKFRNAADCTGRNDKVNKYRMLFVQLIEMHVSRLFSARSEGSGVGEKRHPGGDRAQGPQRGARKRRAHLHETADGECECHNILLSTSCCCCF